MPAPVESRVSPSIEPNVRPNAAGIGRRTCIEIVMDVTQTLQTFPNFCEHTMRT
jgi:hypothetical protein